MINRVLIRIKVLQMIYAFYQKGPLEMRTAEKELMTSLHKTYDLYHLLLLLIVELTRMYERIIDARRNKYRPTEEELHPETRLLNNRLARLLAGNEALQKYASDNVLSWNDDGDFIRKVLDLILKSDVYSEYLDNPNDNYRTDCEFWRHVIKRVLCDNEYFDEYLEEKCLYWNEDIDIIESFVLKTINRLEENGGTKQELLPMFNNQDDYDYCLLLFREAIYHGEEYRARISRHTKNWEQERLAQMDIIIMQTAIAEFVFCPSIPVNVTLDEYIDAAKYYSTPKSSYFVNGVLDAIVDELRKEKKIFK